jgi:hypothetical protein
MIASALTKSSRTRFTSVFKTPSKSSESCRPKAALFGCTRKAWLLRQRARVRSQKDDLSRIPKLLSLLLPSFKKEKPQRQLIAWRSLVSTTSSKTQSRLASRYERQGARLRLNHLSQSLKSSLIRAVQSFQSQLRLSTKPWRKVAASAHIQEAATSCSKPKLPHLLALASHVP